MPVEKTAIQELTGDQLDMLVAFSKGGEYELLKELAEKEKYKRYKSDFLMAKDTEEMNFYRGVYFGIDFIIDAVQRAKEELKAREAEVDNEEDLK